MRSVRRRLRRTSARAPTYDPSGYWEELHKRGDLTGVGQSGLPQTLNQWLYRSWRRSLRRFADDYRLPERSSTARMFEAGAGTGYWVDFWASRGIAAIDGCDLAPAAVTRLNDSFGHLGEFWQADVAAAEPPARRAYDFVECQNVLLHITDDERFSRAVSNLGRLVAPGGTLLLAEPALRNSGFAPAFDAAQESRARPLAQYVTPLRGAGFELVAVRGYAVIANNPIEGSPVWTYAIWRTAWAIVVGLCRLSRSNANWLGPLLYFIDGILTKSRLAPSGKLILLRRAGDDPQATDREELP
jgi:SAM-dependent methyltransferase